MKLPEGRWLLCAAMACALCLTWGWGPAAAQDTDRRIYGEDSDKPAHLGPKPKPIRGAYVEPALGPAEPKPPKQRKPGRTAQRPQAQRPQDHQPQAPKPKAHKPKAHKPKERKPLPAVAPSPAQPSKPKLVREPKPRPKQVRAAKPQPRPAVAAPVKVSTRVVQQALNRAGHPVPVDGKMNKKTRQALRSFQRAHGLPATGQADRPTLARLGLL